MKQLVLLILFAVSGTAYSQEPGDTTYFKPKYRRGLKYEVKTTQNTVTGFLLRETANTVVIEDKKEHHIYEILKNSIVSMKPLPDKRVMKDDYLGENYHAHTYMFSSSSIVSDEPVSYVNYQWLLCENINFGLTKNWQVTTNTIFLYPMSLGVKCNYEISPDTYVGGNVFAVGNISNRISAPLFFGYGALARITRGTPNNNFSFSGGVLGINSDLFSTTTQAGVINLPFANFAYANRFHEKWSVCLEGWYFPEVQSGFAGVGFKFLRSTDTAWTLGCFTYVKTVNNTVTANLRTMPIPYIGVTSNIMGH